MAHHTAAPTTPEIVPKPRPQPKKHTEEVCPTCDLTCFERPRYFCGQLLTDVELTSQQQYEIDKHRLHNRMLHGAGVVCGLRVQCHPKCDGQVLISPGYAIDCCGRDIIVCEPTPFDVIKEIEKYEAEKRGEGCIPPPTCPEKREYCLALVYDETLARPVTALVGCNGQSSTRCEPSRIAEGFKIKLFERPIEEPAWPPLVVKIRECVLPLGAPLRVVQNTQNYRSIQSVEDTIRPAVIAIHRQVITMMNKLGIRCALPEEVRELRWPEYKRGEEEAYMRGVLRAMFAMAWLVIQFLIDCFCEALLIDCPECTELPVIIACVEVEEGEILHICNTARRTVVSFPSLGYWLGPVTGALARRLSGGKADSIAELVELLCCELDVLKRIGRFPRGVFP